PGASAARDGRSRRIRRERIRSHAVRPQGVGQGWPTTTYRDVLVASPGRRHRRRLRMSSY
ncbi:MAG TPA: hypothetical protein VIM41_09610, partial [Gammaproteobacteria bacterium]